MLNTKEITMYINETEKNSNPLDKFSLRGMSEKIAKQIMEAVFVLFGIALLGQPI